MLNNLLEYLLSALRKQPFAKRLLAKLRAFVTRNPIILFGAIGLTLIYVFFNPEVLPDFIRPGHKCYAVKIDALGEKDGDQLQDDGDRPCEPRSAVAVEWYNWAKTDLTNYVGKTDLKSSQPTKNLITANILISGVAVAPADKSTWREHNLFGRSNRFLWTASGTLQDTFEKDGCGFDPTDVANEQVREARRGVALRLELRSDPALPYDQWISCYRLPPSDPQFSYCRWGRYEIFIQTLAPENWCSLHTFFDRWHWRGTKKVSTQGMPNLELKEAARNRWDKGNDVNVPEARWKKLSAGMQNLCMRWVGPQDENLKEKSKWWTVGKIGAVWCDY